MGKKSAKKAAKKAEEKKGVAAAEESGALVKMKGKTYDQELRALHVELVKLQQWVHTRGSRCASCSRAATVPARAAPSRRSPSA